MGKRKDKLVNIVKVIVIIALVAMRWNILRFIMCTPKRANVFILVETILVLLHMSL